MKIADYLLNVSTFLDSRNSGEIDDDHGGLALLYACDEEKFIRDGAWVKRWKH